MSIEAESHGLLEVSKFLRAAVRSHLNIIVIGDPLSRSEMFNQLTELIPENERMHRKLLDELLPPQISDLFHWLKSGYNGAIVTVEADTARESLDRLMTMYQQAHPGTSEHVARELLAGYLDLIIVAFQLTVVRPQLIVELQGIEDYDTDREIITLSDIFRYDADTGHWQPSPFPPKVLRKMRATE